MSGLFEDNRRAFWEAQIYLEDLGYKVLNPHNLSLELTERLGRSPTYPECLKEDIRRIATDVDALYMLNGWHRSPGAQLEQEVALRLEFPVLFQPHR